jgi:hypothetical protein
MLLNYCQQHFLFVLGSTATIWLLLSPIAIKGLTRCAAAPLREAKKNFKRNYISSRNITLKFFL